MGGGGDVVGALATAEFMRLYDGAEPILGGLSWERRSVDPVPGPRRFAEIEHVEEIAPGIMLTGPETRVRGRDVYFAESRIAGLLRQSTLLVDVHDGPAAIARGLAKGIARLERDLIVFVDVGGDVLARGDEAGLRSPLCDALMLAAASRLASAGYPVLLGIFGIACDAELTLGEVLARLALVASAGGLCGARGLTGPVAQRLEEAVSVVPTEASAQALRAFRGASGLAKIRDGAKELELSSIAALTVYLDVDSTVRATGRLSRAVAGAVSLDAANVALHRLGASTELDLERQAASSLSAH